MFAALFSSSSHSPRLEIDSVRAALDPFGQTHLSGSWADDRAQLVQIHTPTTPESAYNQAPYHCPATGVHVVSWTRLDNRNELLAQLNLTEPAARVPDAQLLARAFHRWGKRCVERLVGAFSFAVYDPRANRLFVARDPMGLRPLFYSATADRCIIATSAAVFHAVADLRLTPSQSWIARYLTSQSASHDSTPWPEVRKLPGGHSLMFDECTFAPEPQRYFEFRDDPPHRSRRSDTWVDEYRSVLDEAVQCRVRSTYPVGAESSGGLDSSTCLAFAARGWDRPLDELHAFGFINHEREPDFIFETTRALGVVNEHIEPLPVDGPAVDEQTLAVLGYPAEAGGGSSRVRLVSSAASHGVRTMLSGFGGDEGVSSSGELLVRQLVRDRHYATLIRNTSGPVLLRPARAAKRAYRSRHAAQYQRDGVRSISERTGRYSLRDDVLHTSGLTQSFTAPYRTLGDTDGINSWVLKQLSSPFIVARLENTMLLANASGVEYQWPLLDVRLIQQYLSTPAIHKWGPLSRYLHRSAIRGIVPDKVALNPNKDMGPTIRPAPVASAVTTTRDVATDLHPMLEAVIDRTKLDALLDRVSKSSTAPAADDRFIVTRQAARLRAANLWLQRYHP